MKLEKMDDFFAARVDGYDEHMRTNIEGASGFYAYTASLLPRAAGSRLAGITKTPAGQCPAGQTVSKAPVFEKKIGALLTVRRLPLRRQPSA